MAEADRGAFTQTILHSDPILLTLLDDILDLSKVESGKMELELLPFDIRQLLDESRSLFASTATQKGLALDVHGSGSSHTRYLGDVTRLRQMLNHLVSNAIKFTRAGRGEVSATDSEPDPHLLLTFAVKDKGIGISASKQTQLLQPLSQVDASTTREFGDAGLGLSIVRSLCHLRGGEVGLESEEGSGSHAPRTVPR